jgi:hypothetical protein
LFNENNLRYCYCPFLHKSFKTLLYNKENKCFIDIETYFNEPGWSYPFKKKIFKATLYRGFNDIERNEISNFKNEIENALKESLIYKEYNFSWKEKMIRFYNKNRFQKIISIQI